MRKTLVFVMSLVLLTSLVGCSDDIKNENHYQKEESIEEISKSDEIFNETDKEFEDLFEDSEDIDELFEDSENLGELDEDSLFEKIDEETSKNTQNKGELNEDSLFEKIDNGVSENNEEEKFVVKLTWQGKGEMSLGAAFINNETNSYPENDFEDSFNEYICYANNKEDILSSSFLYESEFYPINSEYDIGGYNKITVIPKRIRDERVTNVIFVASDYDMLGEDNLTYADISISDAEGNIIDRIEIGKPDIELGHIFGELYFDGSNWKFKRLVKDFEVPEETWGVYKCFEMLKKEEKNEK